MDFLELKPGYNIVRLLTNPWQYLCHSKFVVKDRPRYGQKLKCPAYIENIKCALCDGNVKHQRRWLFGVYSTVYNKQYLLDTDYKIFRGIKNIACDPAWGNPIKYDINICLDESTSPFVVPYPPAQRDLESFDTDIMKALTIPTLEDLAIINSKNYQEI